MINQMPKHPVNNNDNAPLLCKRKSIRIHSFRFVVFGTLTYCAHENVGALILLVHVTVSIMSNRECHCRVACSTTDLFKDSERHMQISIKCLSDSYWSAVTESSNGLFRGRWNNCVNKETELDTARPTVAVRLFIMTIVHLDLLHKKCFVRLHFQNVLSKYRKFIVYSWTPWLASSCAVDV